MASDNHPLPEVVRADIGGWVSGPCATEPVRVESIRKGDLIVHDGRVLTVTEQPLRAWYRQDGERVCGLEIATSADGSGWSSRWSLFRGYGEIVHRVTL